MKTYSFEYQSFLNKKLPIIPLTLIQNEKELNIDAFIDTGATYSIFHSKFAEILEIDFEKGGLINITIGDGSSIPVFLHTLTMQIGEDKFEAKVGFSNKLGIGFNLLGRFDVFDKAVFCFDEKQYVIRVIFE